MTWLLILNHLHGNLLKIISCLFHFLSKRSTYEPFTKYPGRSNKSQITVKVMHQQSFGLEVTNGIELRLVFRVVLVVVSVWDVRISGPSDKGKTFHYNCTVTFCWLWWKVCYEFSGHSPLIFRSTIKNIFTGVV